MEGNKINMKESLAINNPELSKQWHPNKNRDLTPNDVTKGSGKEVWWQCKKGHEWEAIIKNRAKGSGCPFCSGRSACENSSLQALNPDLAKQWHPTKNGDLTPKKVRPNSNKKAWWVCEKGHEWEAIIANRTKGRGCAKCSQGNNTSFPEQAIYFYVKSVFCDTINRYKFNDKWEIDVFVPSLNFGIEYDGIYYHQDRKIIDSQKGKYLSNEGVRLLRVKESEKITIDYFHKNDVIYCDRGISEHQLSKVIKACFDYISENITHKPHIVDINVKRDRAKIYDLYIKGEREESLFSKFPELSKEWHPTKNLRIKPDMVKSFSKKKVWWICEREHEWEASIGSRASGKNCPYCSGQRVCVDNCLQTLYPGLSKQWHPTKNADLTPDDVTSSSNKKVRWICGNGHEWEAIINDRTNGNGCPFCSGHRACVDNCLQTLYPELSKQWHPTKNADLTPDDVTSSSNKKVRWICGNGHEWETTINNRTKGKSCPYCTGQRVCVDNSLQTLNPELSKQWHPIKNGDLTPDNVTKGSHKKVRWICGNGHEWESTIYNRTNGNGCPHCRKLKKLTSSSLKTGIH